MSNLIQPLVVYVFFTIFVFATIEVIKGLYKSFFDKIKKPKKIHKSSLRVLNFVISYFYAMVFNYQFANIILGYSGSKVVLNNYVNYLIVASLMYVGSKKIWQSYYNNNKKILAQIKDIKQTLED